MVGKGAIAEVVAGVDHDSRHLKLAEGLRVRLWLAPLRPWNVSCIRDPNTPQVRTTSEK